MKPFFAVLFIAASLLGSQAKASTFDFDFTDGTTDFSGSLTTSSTGSPELITSITGTYDGATATLAPVGSVAFNPSNDNLLYPDMTGVGYDSNGTSGLIDGGGIGFYSGGSLFNLYYFTDVPGNYELDNFTDPSDPTFVASAPFTISVPEPATWVMMIGGISGLGASFRSRRRVALSA
jgi:hypothetical protein